MKNKIEYESAIMNYTISEDEFEVIYFIGTLDKRLVSWCRVSNLKGLKASWKDEITSGYCFLGSAKMNVCYYVNGVKANLLRTEDLKQKIKDGQFIKLSLF